MGASDGQPHHRQLVSQAGQNTNRVMARIMDTCDSPRWNIQKDVIPDFATRRKEEPSCPIGMAELQGGRFSRYRSKLCAEQDGVSAAQLNMHKKAGHQ
jgi:hypothetical protein